MISFGLGAAQLLRASYTLLQFEMEPNGRERAVIIFFCRPPLFRSTPHVVASTYADDQTPPARLYRQEMTQVAEVIARYRLRTSAFRTAAMTAFVSC